jgi:2-keto-3-deoxy-L-rhamnonate aldolase RhmA
MSMANVEFRQRLVQAAEPMVGVITSFNSVELIECVGRLGLDFVIIDTEHGAIGVEAAAHMVRAAHSVGLAGLVRVPSFDGPAIGRLCDAGADGVVLPHVESAATVRDFVRSLRYPPLGTRGIRRATPAAEWGRRDVVEHIGIENSGICAIVQIETESAVAAAREIVSVDGVDAVIVGVNDLSVSMNLAGQAASEPVQRKCREVLEVASQLGVTSGGAGHTSQSIAELVAAGGRLIVGDLAVCVAESVRQLVARADSR